MDDWGSCGQACGKTSAGILVHGVLQYCIETGLPSWGSMLPPNDRENNDTISMQRLRIQKKAWRSKCFLNDGEKRLRCLLLCWIAISVECLMWTLDHMDSGSKGLFDAVIDSPLNPFVKARSGICAMLNMGFAGPLGLLRGYFPADYHYTILNEARAMGLNMEAQLWWRFLLYGDFPRRFVAMVHPGLTKERQYSHADAFCALKQCCVERRMALKVKQLHSRPMTLFHDAALRKLLVLLAHAYKFTNMRSERLLASIRQACDADRATIERVCASGLLSQALTGNCFVTQCTFNPKHAVGTLRIPTAHCQEASPHPSLRFAFV